jgi:hypothetical protein
MEETGMKAGVHRPMVELEFGAQRLRVGLLQIRVLRLLELFGSESTMAEFFAVDRSEPGRWARGLTPTGVKAAQLADLSFVWERATEDQHDDAVRIWLTSPNRFLGERPIDAVVAGGVGDVVAAWDAYQESSYA